MATSSGRRARSAAQGQLDEAPSAAPATYELQILAEQLANFGARSRHVTPGFPKQKEKLGRLLGRVTFCKEYVDQILECTPSTTSI